MKLNYRTLTISQQILLVAIGLSLTLVVFLLSFSANQVITTKNSIKVSVNENRSFGAIEKIDRNFYERFGDVQAFAYNRIAIEAIDSGRATLNSQKFINTMVSYYVLYDLMMILDASGKVIAVNTLDKQGIPVRTESLVGKNFAQEEWFRVCVSANGPDGGAWYSDFQVNALVGQIYNSKGFGMSFAAPIKNDKAEVIGVWYNFASWRDVTQGIRIEIEELVKQDDPEAFLLITDRVGKVIDAADESLIENLQLEDKGAMDKNGFEFTFNGAKISSENYVAGVGQGKGAYTYKGHNWKAYTFVPKDKFSFSLFFGELFALTSITIFILVTGIIVFLILSRNISRRISSLQHAINSISKGELVEVTTTSWTDEIGQMTNSVKLLTNGLRDTSLFANEIGNGNLDASFKPLSESDVLGASLVTMRNNLLKIRNDDEKRRWITQGLAEFGENLRRSSGGFSELCNKVILFICKYTGANQAAIFIKEGDGNENYLIMVSCYAWNRKKFTARKIAEGEGLIGQVWQEGEMIYLVEVPNDFVQITSGLGEANPKCIIILPLISNDEVLGVLEMASFKKLEEHEIEFLKKLCESLGSTLASEKINERTKKLLQKTQEQTESMRSQEEELRQNIEEMQATQEDFYRKEKEYQATIEQLNLEISKS